MSFLEEVEHIFAKHSSLPDKLTARDTDVVSLQPEHEVPVEVVVRDTVEAKSNAPTAEYFFDKNDEPLSF